MSDSKARRAAQARAKAAQRFTKSQEFELQKQSDDNRAKMRMAIIVQAGVVIRTICAYGTLGVCGYFAYRAVETMSGKETSFRSIIQWGVNLGIGEIFAGLAVIGLGAGWYKTNKTLKRTREQFGPRMAEMEKMIDPVRTSSNLKDDGTSSESDLT